MSALSGKVLTNMIIFVFIFVFVFWKSYSSVRLWFWHIRNKIKMAAAAKELPAAVSALQAVAVRSAAPTDYKGVFTFVEKGPPHGAANWRATGRLPARGTCTCSPRCDRIPPGCD